MPRYAVAGRSGTPTAVANAPVAVLWNPHAAKAIKVREVYYWKTAITLVAQLALVRISTRGTPGSTITPDADNDFERLVAPISGAVLDLAQFSVLPTAQEPYLERWRFNDTPIGSGVVIVFANSPVIVPAGTGLAIVLTFATATDPADVAFVWDE